MHPAFEPVDLTAFVGVVKHRIEEVGADRALAELLDAALANAKAARRDERATLLRVAEAELGKRPARHLALALMGDAYAATTTTED